MPLPEDIAMAADAGIMLAKNRIIQAAYELFGRLAEKYKMAASHLPEELLKQHPKISKGENYLGQPWVMLDYPRNFSGTGIFAIRTMFWWGNYFSLQLLLKGRYINRLNLAAVEQLSNRNEWFFCTGSNVWQHHFEQDYMVPVSAATPEIIQTQKQTNDFYKIGVKLPVSEWERAEEFFTAKFIFALAMLNQSQLI